MAPTSAALPWSADIKRPAHAPGTEISGARWPRTHISDYHGTLIGSPRADRLAIPAEPSPRSQGYPRPPLGDSSAAWGRLGGRVCHRHPLFAASAVRDEDGNRSQLAGDCWCVWFDRPLTTWRTSPRSNRNNSLPRPLRRAQCRNMKSQCSSMSHRAKALIWPIPGEPQLCKAQELLQFAKEIDPGVGQPKSGSAYKTISYAI